nr:unnamed protein product [Callosobruchus analis]CAI5834607.1 unnamed protein product [Callosobruchus analis]CAI5854683.1 unnamed protein product [Callosobruchus analis]
MMNGRRQTTRVFLEN